MTAWTGKSVSPGELIHRYSCVKCGLKNSKLELTRLLSINNSIDGFIPRNGIIVIIIKQIETNTKATNHSWSCNLIHVHYNMRIRKTQYWTSNSWVFSDNKGHFFSHRIQIFSCIISSLLHSFIYDYIILLGSLYAIKLGQ